MNGSEDSRQLTLISEANYGGDAAIMEKQLSCYTERIMPGFNPESPSAREEFPKGFLWGTATAAYQI